MLKVLRKLLQKVIDDIDCGNCHMTDNELQTITDGLRRLTREDKMMSKYEACRYLGISRATFDRKVKDNMLPQGKKRAGFKELAWSQRELDSYAL